MTIWKTTLTALFLAPAMTLSGTALDAQTSGRFDQTSNPNVIQESNRETLGTGWNVTSNLNADTIKVDTSLAFPVAGATRPETDAVPEQIEQWFPAKPRKALVQNPQANRVSSSKGNLERALSGQVAVPSNHRFSAIEVVDVKAGKDNPFASHPAYKKSLLSEPLSEIAIVQTNREHYAAPQEVPSVVETSQLPEPEAIADLMPASPLKPHGDDECVVEIVPGDNQGYRLQLSVPESVESVDVVRGDDSEPLQFNLVAEKDWTQDVAPVLKSTKAQEAVAPVADVILNRQHASNAPKTRYKINPYYNANSVGSSMHADNRESHRDAKISLVEAQLPVSESTPIRSARKTGVVNDPPRTMPEPAVDIRQLRSLLQPQSLDASEMPSPLPVSIHPLGPVSMTPKGTADFSVELRNDAEVSIRNFDLRLSMPEGMVVKVLDRPAAYNAEHHTVTWNVEELGQGESMTIRYRVESVQEGRHIQAFEVGAANRFGEPTTCSTTAIR